MTQFYFGTVVDVNDDEKLGRVKVKLHGLHQSIADEDLPWSFCMQPIHSAASQGFGFSPTGIIQGSEVICIFVDPPYNQTLFVLGTFAAQNDVSPYATSSVEVARDSRIPREPERLYSPSYPDNKTFTTPGNHLIEIDDTEGFERIHIKHASGSSIEMYADGNVVAKTYGDHYRLIAGRDYRFVEDGVVEKIKNNMRITVVGDALIEANGEITLKAPTINFNNETFEEDVAALDDAAPPPEEFGEDLPGNSSIGEYQAAVEQYNQTASAGSEIVDDNLEPIDVPKGDRPVLPVNCQGIKLDTQYRGNYKGTSYILTPADIITKLRVKVHPFIGEGKAKRWPQKAYHVGKPDQLLTREEALCNASALITNVLIPLFNEFGPDVFYFNSGYRNNGGASWHEGACAVDLQLRITPTPGRTVKYLKWVLENCNFEELFVERSGQTIKVNNQTKNKSWLHIAYNRNHPKGGVREVAYLCGVTSRKIPGGLPAEES